MTHHTATQKLAMVALFLLLPLTCPLESTAAETINRIVATVNDTVITLKDLQDEGAAIFKKIEREVSPSQIDGAMRAARKEILSSLIDKKIIEQRAAMLGFSVSDRELDANIDEMLKAKRISRKTFLAEIAKIGDTFEHYRSIVRIQILQSKLINFDVRSKVVITDDKIRNYYDTQFTSQNGAGGFHIQQIGVVWGNGRQKKTKEQARKIIEDLHAKAVAGENFEDLARAGSELPSATDGGDIGVFQKDEMAPYMRLAVSSIKAGEISQIVESHDTFQFFKLLASKIDNVVDKAPYETVKDDIHKKLYEEALQQSFKEWIKQMRDEADINEFL